jgi:hypothetical protein
MSFTAVTSLFSVFNALKGGNIPGEQKTYSEQGIFQDNLIVNENHLIGKNSVTLGQSIKTGSVFMLKNPLDIKPTIPSLFNLSGGILGWVGPEIQTPVSLKVGSFTAIGNVNLFGKINVNGLDLMVQLARGLAEPSDERLKENIETIQNPLQKVTAMRGVSYKFKETEKQEVGVIAQEVEKILPEVVIDATDGYKAVKYQNMVGLLIEAIKEQQKQIDELKQTVMELRNESAN